MSEQEIIRALTEEIDELKAEIKRLGAEVEDLMRVDYWQDRYNIAAKEIEALKAANLRETCYAADLKVELDTLRDNLKGLVNRAP